MWRPGASPLLGRLMSRNDYAAFFGATCSNPVPGDLKERIVGPFARHAAVRRGVPGATLPLDADERRERPGVRTGEAAPDGVAAEPDNRSGHGRRSNHHAVLRAVQRSAPAGTGVGGEHASGPRARAGRGAADPRARRRLRDRRPDAGAGGELAGAHRRRGQPCPVHRRAEREGAGAGHHGPTGSPRGGHAPARLRRRLLRPDLVRRRHLHHGCRGGPARLAPACCDRAGTSR